MGATGIARIGIGDESKAFGICVIDDLIQRLGCGVIAIGIVDGYLIPIPNFCIVGIVVYLIVI